MPDENGRWLVNRNRYVPLHKQIEDDLRERIVAGYWSPGTLSTSEADMCALYDASRTTVRQALRALVDEGLIVRERGRGTFIRDPLVTAGARGLTSFTEEMGVSGRSSGAVVLEQTTVVVPTEVASRLHLAETDEVVKLRRLRYADDEPIGLQTAYLPSARFPGLDQLDVQASLYRQLEATYGVAPTDAVELFSVIAMTEEQARMLGVRPHTPGFHVERVTYDGTTAFEYVVSVLRGDKYKVKLMLHREKGDL